MSWFRHTPPKHPPPIRPHVQHHRSSPATERIKEESKAIGPQKQYPDKKSSTT